MKHSFHDTGAIKFSSSNDLAELNMWGCTESLWALSYHVRKLGFASRYCYNFRHPNMSMYICIQCRNIVHVHVLNVAHENVSFSITWPKTRRLHLHKLISMLYVCEFVHYMIETNIYAVRRKQIKITYTLSLHDGSQASYDVRMTPIYEQQLPLGGA